MNLKLCCTVFVAIVQLLFQQAAFSAAGTMSSLSPEVALENTLSVFQPIPKLVATELEFKTSVTGDIDQGYQVEGIYQLALKADGERLKLSIDTEYYRLVPNRTHLSSGFSQTVVNGEDLLKYETTSPRDSMIRSSTPAEDSAARARRIWSDFEFINGYIPTRGPHISEMLASADRVEWLTAPADTGHPNDAMQYILRAESEYGTFTFWFNEQSGTHPSKIVRDVSGADILTYRPANAAPMLPKDQPELTSKYPLEALQHVVYTINFEDFSTIDGRHVPMSGWYLEDRTYESGKKLEFMRSVKRSRRDLDPVFTDADFTLDAPTGTRVTVTGSGGIDHVWEDGRVRKMTSEEKLAGLDGAIGDVRDIWGPRASARSGSGWALYTFGIIAVSGVAGAVVIYLRRSKK